MKTKFKCFGKSTLSLVLAVMMMVSCVFVGNSETVKDVETSDEITVKVPNAEIEDDAAEAADFDEATDETSAEKLDKISGERETTQKTDSTTSLSTAFMQKKVYQSSGGTSKTFYFVKPITWTSIGLWIWKGSGDGAWATSPALVNKGNIYKLTIDTDNVDHVIITDTANWDNKTGQTANIDLTSVDGNCFYIKGISDSVVQYEMITKSDAYYTTPTQKIYFNLPASGWSGSRVGVRKKTSSGYDYENITNNIETINEVSYYYASVDTSAYNEISFYNWHSGNKYNDGKTPQRATANLVVHGHENMYCLPSGNSGTNISVTWGDPNPSTHDITDSGTWYLQGRIDDTNWHINGDTTYALTDKGNGVWEYDTNQTLKQLATIVDSNSNWSHKYLMFRKKYSDDNTWSNYYPGQNTTSDATVSVTTSYTSYQNVLGYNNANTRFEFETNFSNSTDTTHKVILCIKESESGVQFKYRLDNITDTTSSPYYLRGDATKVKTAAGTVFTGDLWSDTVFNSDAVFHTDVNGKYYIDATLDNSATFKVITKDTSLNSNKWYSPSNNDGNRNINVNGKCDLYTRSSNENLTFTGDDGTRCRIYITDEVSNNDAAFAVELKSVYSVTVNDTREDNGTPATANQSYAPAGDKVTITVTPPTGKIPYGTFVGGTITFAPTATAGEYAGTFTMPESDTTVTVNYRNPQTYSITAVEDDATKDLGVLSTTSASYTEGSTTPVSLTATATANSGKMVEWEFSNDDYVLADNTTLNSNTIKFFPGANTNVTVSYVDQLFDYEGTSAYLFVYTDKPTTRENITSTAAKAKLYYNSNNELLAKFTIDDTTNIPSNILKSNTNYYFAFSPTDNAENTKDYCHTSDTYREKGTTNNNQVPSFCNSVSFNGHNIQFGDNDSRTYDYLVAKLKENATSFYLYIGTVDSSTHTTATLNGTSPRFELAGATEATEGKVEIYAKTGTIRNVSSNDNESALGDYDKYSFFTDISLTYANGTSVKTKDSKPYTVTGTSGSVKHYRLRKATVKKGQSITVTATIHDSDAKNMYYIRGFVANGRTVGSFNEWNSSGVYSCTLPIESDQTIPIEITPVYYYRTGYTGAPSVVTFKAEDFSGAVRTKWGNTISCYAYYEDGGSTRGSGDSQDALGGYPGQPMLSDGDFYVTQVPLTNNDGKKVKGVTLNNYVWDDVHGQTLISYKDFNGIQSDGQVGSNAQTYDYDDFAAIADLGDVEDIIFNFKYHTDNGSQNGGQGTGGNTGNYSTSTVAETVGNTWTPVNLDDSSKFSTTGQYFPDTKTSYQWFPLVDYFDIPVDLFGNRLVTDSTNVDLDVIKNHVNYSLVNGTHFINDAYILDDTTCSKTSKYYVVSDGYVNYYGKQSNGTALKDNTNPLNSDARDYLGEYATMWHVYKYDENSANYTLIGSLPPSAFITKSTFAADYKDWLNNDGTLKNWSEKSSVPAAFLAYTSYDDNGTAKYSTGTSARAEMWKEYVTIYNETHNKPVQIKYEASIKSGGREGSNNGINKNIGTRCDGRWYYSRNDLPIGADIKIWIRDNSDTVKSNNYIYRNKLNDNGDYDYFIQDDYIVETETVGETTLTSKTHKGTVTLADAYFTNEKPADVLTQKSFYGLTTATVNVDKSDTFRFTASASKVNSYDYTVTGGKAVKNTSAERVDYDFVGWYGYSGNTFNFISKDYAEARDMTSNVTLIAVYEKSKINTESKTLKIVHDLYANKSNYDLPVGAGANVPDVTNGRNGVTKFDVVITDADGNKYPYNNISGATTINEHIVSGSTITVTCYTEPGADNTVYVNNGVPGVYKYDSTNGYVSSSSTGNWTYDSSNTSTGRTTYTISVDDLFGSDNSKNLYFFTNLFRNYITVKYKYYDRDTTLHSVPVNMSDDPKETTVTITGITPETTVEQFKTKLAPYINTTNQMDDYKYWMTQAIATGSGGFGDLPYYGSSDNKTYSSYYGTINDADNKSVTNAFAYHTTKFGKPQYAVDSNNNTFVDGDLKRASDRERWASYYDATGNLLSNNDELNNSSTLETTSAVTLWLYNWPKEYTVHVFCTKQANGVTTTNAVAKVNDGLYVSTADVTDSGLKGYYNQRLGVVDSRPNAITNGGTEYLSGYGIESPYFGGSQQEFNAVANATYGTGNDMVSLVFDGWYACNTSESSEYVKVSTDRSYQNRVTNNMYLYAGYRPVADAADKVTVSVSDVKIDRYADVNGVEQVRFNSQLNVGGEYVVDSDPNIKYVSAIYFDLPTTDSEGKAIDWTNSDNKAALQNYLTTVDSTTNKTGLETIRGYVEHHVGLVKDLSNFQSNGDVGGYYRTYTTKNCTVEVTGVTTTKKGKVDCFTFKVITTGTPDVDSHTVKLTTKNRIEFTRPMTYDEYTSNPFFVFIAVKYDNTDKSTGSQKRDGMEDEDYNDWVVSSNCITNIDDEDFTPKLPNSSSSSSEDPIRSVEESVVEEVDSNAKSVGLETSGDAESDESIEVQDDSVTTNIENDSDESNVEIINEDDFVEN